MHLEPIAYAKALAIGSAVHNGLQDSLQAYIDGLDEDGVAVGLRDVQELKRIASEAITQTFQRIFDLPDREYSSLVDPLMVEGVAQAAVLGWWNLIDRIGFPFSTLEAVEEVVKPLIPEPDFFENDEKIDPMLRMTGKIDGRLRNDTGVALIEHKTRASFGIYDWTNYLNMDPQALWYLTMWNQRARVLGKKEDKCNYFWYNGIAKNSHRTPKDYDGLLERRLGIMQDEPSKYFFIQEIYVEDGVLELYQQRLKDTLSELNRANRDMDFNWNPKYCDSYSSSCPYRKLCSMGCTPQNVTKCLEMIDWSSSFVVEEVNVELSETPVEGD
jgi:hypothetical protein